ncbi:dihydrolipoamide acetyltransferase family protein [Halocatena pleomorpha]|uniref:2-oxo acid dehydrogenase subunit E2 n=1 Tax=Halocatena pleomorpha TaxID=1785090 RepID=A0A3P3RD90_9EURY|nr:dihydrolipoamide acetyltransferase family protein [Halocatena pleomorpha]RRJ31426.1 2-oxo acid dehydrogenase subunit E2 [Halocatena pleomorpha]
MTAFEFRLPDPGEGLTEAEITEWHVQVGDEIEEDDVLCEIETDKAVSDVPSPCPGTIEDRSVSEGDVVDVGTVIVTIETENPPRQQVSGETEPETEEPEDGAEESEEAEVEQAVQDVQEERVEAASAPEAETDVTKGRVFAAPRTRRYAREENVNLSDVDGSGPDGRVLQEDIDAYLQETEPERVERAHPSVAIESEPVEEDESRSTRRELSGLRGTIAENMTRSKTIIPHLTSGFEADASELVALKERLDGKHDVHITYTPLLVKAVVPALKQFPIVNASIDDTTDEIVEKHYYNIGVATHTDDGLIVPVITDVDTKSVVEIAEELQTLAEQARDRSIDMSALQGGTFTVTNLATYGEHRTAGTPIINHPEAAILGIGRIRRKPVATDESTVEVRQRLGLDLSYDHRLIDGAVANQFMEFLITGIEDPDLLLSRI